MDTIFNAIVWDPGRSPFSIFGFEIRYYSLLWIIALVAGYLVVKKIYKREKIDEKLFDPLFIYCFLGILIGARLGHCLFYEPDYYLSHPIEIVFPFHNGEFTGYQGLASHGGTVGLLLALLIYIKKTKLKLVWVLDCIGIAAPLFGSFIRLGNFMNSEIYGNVTDLPWGMIFVQAGESEPCHPAQLYEAIAYMLLFFVVLYIYYKNQNKVGSGLFIGFSVFSVFLFRFFVEFVKKEQVGFEKDMFINMGQILSIPLIITGFCFIYHSFKWKKEKNGKPSLESKNKNK